MMSYLLMELFTQKSKWKSGVTDCSLAKAAFTCLKLTIETLQQRVKYVQS